jgi:hypothetical protein
MDAMTPTALIELAMLAPEVLLRGSPDVPGSDYTLPTENGELQIFTPRIAPHLRLRLFVTEADFAKIKRGKGWKAMVTDQPSGLAFAVKAASCDIPTCYCAANVVAVTVKP